METKDLDAICHDLRNAVTALASGCLLIESHLPPGSPAELREVLVDMRAELDRATALLAGLKEIAKRTPAEGPARRTRH
jgi:hypothetical protein